MPNQRRRNHERNGNPISIPEPVNINLGNASQLIETAGVADHFPLSNLQSVLELALRHSEVWVNVAGELHIPLQIFRFKTVTALFIFIFRKDEHEDTVWHLTNIKRIDR